MVDLHCHTKHSDGTWNTVQLLQQAERKGITLLSITDHDTLESYFDLFGMDYSQYYSGEILVGCEFAAVFNGIRIELLGYSFDLFVVQKWLDDFYRRVEKKKSFCEEYDQLLALCKKHNVAVDAGDMINPSIEYPIAAIHRNIKQHPQNRHLFDRASWVSQEVFFRNCTCNVNFPLHLECSTQVPKAEDIADVIREAGGFVFLAHAFAYSLSDYNAFLNQIADARGIDGLEVYCSKHSTSQANYLSNFCRKRGLLVSGGSDCHGMKNPSRKLGTGFGGLCVNEKEIMAWAGQRNSDQYKVHN
ncbi:MAG: PHP domain-containing protein [Clostridia bacterium]|nr:PHP domain-containing protein [Clostridia bacterium]